MSPRIEKPAFWDSCFLQISMKPGCIKLWFDLLTFLYEIDDHTRSALGNMFCTSWHTNKANNLSNEVHDFCVRIVKKCFLDSLFGKVFTIEYTGIVVLSKNMLNIEKIAWRHQLTVTTAISNASLSESLSWAGNTKPVSLQFLIALFGSRYYFDWTPLHRRWNQNACRADKFRSTLIGTLNNDLVECTHFFRNVNVHISLIHTLVETLSLLVHRTSSWRYKKRISRYDLIPKKSSWTVQIPQSFVSASNPRQPGSGSTRFVEPIFDSCTFSDPKLTRTLHQFLTYFLHFELLF